MSRGVEGNRYVLFEEGSSRAFDFSYYYFAVGSGILFGKYGAASYPYGAIAVRDLDMIRVCQIKPRKGGKERGEN